MLFGVDFSFSIHSVTELILLACKRESICIVQLYLILKVLKLCSVFSGLTQIYKLPTRFVPTSKGRARPGTLYPQRITQRWWSFSNLEGWKPNSAWEWSWASKLRAWTCAWMSALTNWASQAYRSLFVCWQRFLLLMNLVDLLSDPWFATKINILTTQYRCSVLLYIGSSVTGFQG
jgi:hypothetical protein